MTRRVTGAQNFLYDLKMRLAVITDAVLEPNHLEWKINKDLVSLSLSWT